MTDAERDELLARIDERTEAIPALERAVRELRDEVDRRFDALRSEVSTRYVTREEFTALAKRVDGTVTQDQFGPVRLVVYSGVGLILTAVVGALIALVVVGRPV